MVLKFNTINLQRHFFFPVALVFPLYFGFAWYFGFGQLKFLGVSHGFWAFFGRVVRVFVWALGVCWVGVLWGRFGCLMGASGVVGLCGFSWILFVG
jgi:hypothetical protein